MTTLARALSDILSAIGETCYEVAHWLDQWADEGGDR